MGQAFDSRPQHAQSRAKESQAPAPAAQAESNPLLQPDAALPSNFARPWSDPSQRFNSQRGATLAVNPLTMPAEGISLETSTVRSLDKLLGSNPHAEFNCNRIDVTIDRRPDNAELGYSVKLTIPDGTTGVYNFMRDGELRSSFVTNREGKQVAQDPFPPVQGIVGTLKESDRKQASEPISDRPGALNKATGALDSGRLGTYRPEASQRERIDQFAKRNGSDLRRWERSVEDKGIEWAVSPKREAEVYLDLKNALKLPPDCNVTELECDPRGDALGAGTQLRGRIEKNGGGSHEFEVDLKNGAIKIAGQHTSPGQVGKTIEKLDQLNDSKQAKMVQEFLDRNKSDLEQWRSKDADNRYVVSDDRVKEIQKEFRDLTRTPHNEVSAITFDTMDTSAIQQGTDRNGKQFPMMSGRIYRYGRNGESEPISVDLRDGSISIGSRTGLKPSNVSSAREARNNEFDQAVHDPRALMEWAGKDNRAIVFAGRSDDMEIVVTRNRNAFGAVKDFDFYARKTGEEKFTPYTIQPSFPGVDTIDYTRSWDVRMTAVSPSGEQVELNCPAAKQLPPKTEYSISEGKVITIPPRAVRAPVQLNGTKMTEIGEPDPPYRPYQ